MASAAELRALARVERDPRQRVRLLAIANVRDGMPVDEAARVTGRGRATPYRWLAREHTRAVRRRSVTARARAGGASSAPSSGPRSGPGCWPARM